MLWFCGFWYERNEIFFKSKHKLYLNTIWTYLHFITKLLYPNVPCSPSYQRLGQKVLKVIILKMDEETRVVP